MFSGVFSQPIIVQIIQALRFSESNGHWGFSVNHVSLLVEAFPMAEDVLEWLADEDDFSHLPWPKGLKTSAVDFFLLELKLNRLKLAEVSLTERAKTATRVILS